MLEKPSDFVLGFDGPADAELCVKLGRLLEAPFDLSCEPGEDHLAALRQQPGIASLALPDPLFKVRIPCRSFILPCIIWMPWMPPFGTIRWRTLQCSSAGDFRPSTEWPNPSPNMLTVDRSKLIRPSNRRKAACHRRD